MSAADLKQRLWAKIDVRSPDDCWLWTGAVRYHQQGWCYGHIRCGAKTYLSHRLVWLFENGGHAEQLTDLVGKVIMHTCDNPRCCNPRHLKLGTLAENNADRAAKGRSADTRGENHNMVKLTAREVLLIRSSNDKSPVLARQFGVDPAHIRNIRQRKTWKHL